MLHDTPVKRGPNKGSSRRSFGRKRRLPSGRWQVAYTGPDAVVYKAPVTFEDEDAAAGWLAKERKLIDLDEWVPPPLRGQGKRRPANAKFDEYSADWLAHRRVKGEPLKPRTRTEYERLLEVIILPEFGRMPIAAITEALVRDWYESMGRNTPTQRARAYALLRTIMNSAVEDKLVLVNPCRIKGAGRSKRAKRIEPATLDELAVIVENMLPERRLAVLLAAWCAMRYGEIAELRRHDVDLKNGRIHVRRAVVIIDGERIVDTPKTEAGARTIAVPPHLVPVIKEHLQLYAQPGRTGLLFHGRDGQQLAESTMMGRPARRRRIKGRIVNESSTGYCRARAAAGREDLSFHDLRHTGAVLAAQAGATLAELMARLGHTTPAAAMVYQHAAAGRDEEIARKLSDMAKGL